MRRGMRNGGKPWIYLSEDECQNCGAGLTHGTRVYLDNCGDYTCWACGNEEVGDEEETE